MSGVWTPAVRAAGLDHRPPYALRHTYAALSIAAGTSLFALARLMGTSVQQTPARWPTPVLPELTLQLIVAGLQEKSRRETELLRQLVAQAVKAAQRSVHLVSLLALIVSLFSLVVALLR